ncbi:hypothetical protein OS242_05140 [Tumebacillus sp. DT12]|uniref:Uncharacterized protein n=1 Tax=Tumebacillus lacus TaxID=2995335 RepID=A0ABT3X004_9BACL|nr:hypothetical protein [Tumebacillus lacus]MCX7569337.1 hypothetical protein [Tumebacillus lacus]
MSTPNTAAKSTYRFGASPNRLLQMDVLYFLVTLLFFYVQLHMVIQFAWLGHITLLALFLNLLCFKLGELAHELFDGGPAPLWIVLAAGSAILSATMPDLSVLYFVFGLAMMKIRVELSAYSARSVKLSSRALGFILAPLFHPVVFEIFVVATFALCLLHIKHIKTNEAPRLHWFTLPENKRVYWTMGVHHAHYFIYCYSIPISFAAWSDLPMWSMGLVFYVGWAAYNAYEKWLRPSWPAFIIGHFIGALSLIGLYYAEALSPLLFWWFMTGLGGGTVFMLHRLVPRPADVVDRELSITEGFGHVFGVAVWGLLIFTVSPESPYLAGAILAALSMFIAYNASKSKNGQPAS